MDDVTDNEIRGLENLISGGKSASLALPISATKPVKISPEELRAAIDKNIEFHRKAWAEAVQRKRETPFSG